MIRGKLIDFEGLGGSGKSTQAMLLKKELESKQIKCTYIHFPNYSSESTGKKIRNYLDNKLAFDIEDFVNLCSENRYEQKEYIESLLEAKNYVIIDRYTLSAIAYQVPKVSQENKQALREKIKELDSNLPQPDKIIFFDISETFLENILEKRGDKDIHEKNLNFVKAVKNEYYNLMEASWTIINPMEKDEKSFRKIDEIFNEMLEKSNIIKEIENQI
jgi:dTMP kinase